MACHIFNKSTIVLPFLSQVTKQPTYYDNSLQWIGHQWFLTLIGFRTTTSTISVKRGLISYSVRKKKICVKCSLPIFLLVSLACWGNLFTTSRNREVNSSSAVTSRSLSAMVSRRTCSSYCLCSNTRSCSRCWNFSSICANASSHSVWEREVSLFLRFGLGMLHRPYIYGRLHGDGGGVLHDGPSNKDRH